jgi:formylglycine-generating enzyme required for sulfatase activity
MSVFINYRRRESEYAAGDIFSVLEEHLPKRVFVDFGGIPLADDFPRVILEAVRSSDVFLCLIGPHWLADSRLKNDPQDWVRREIEVALSSKRTRILPVLLNGATMPSAEELPPSISKLSEKQALAISARDMRGHLTTLKEQVLSLVEAARSRAVVSEIDRACIAGDVFRDAQELPKMVILPEGRFWQGSHTQQRDAEDCEQPRHRVLLLGKRAMSVFPITVAEWNFAVANGLRFQRMEVRSKVGVKAEARAIEKSGERIGFDAYWNWNQFRESIYPVSGIDWHAAVAYTSWISQRTGRSYRLPSESEWEYACRASTQGPYSTGVMCSFRDAHFNIRMKASHQPRLTNRLQWDRTCPRPVTSCTSNKFGVCGMHGNVWEWVLDDFHPDYEGAPKDGAAWLLEVRSENSDERTDKVARGGCYSSGVKQLRSAKRGHAPSSPKHPEKFGFRIVCEIG